MSAASSAASNAPATKFAGLVEYDGAQFSGWAEQPGRRTVEGELRAALGKILRQPVKLSVAGRTDAGVHASRQVVSFAAATDLRPDLLAYKVTAVLPPDAALRRCHRAAEAFDARRDARWRSYEYRVTNGPVRSPLRRSRATYVAQPLDPELLARCAELLRGTHDFRAFTPTRGYHDRFDRVVTESRWELCEESLTYHITADSFLYGMVRALVGTMLEVSQGRRSFESFEYLLGGAASRREAGPSAPARGLTLTGVGYEVLSFDP